MLRSIAILFLLFSTMAQAQGVDAQLIEIDLGREYGFFSKSPAVLRAVSVRPEKNATQNSGAFLCGLAGPALDT